MLWRQVDGLAVVSSFVLTPYTSFWQPDQPTYNPVEACFQLTHPQINGGEKPYYESPRFRVDGSMKVSVGVAGLCGKRCTGFWCSVVTYILGESPSNLVVSIDGLGEKAYLGISQHRRHVCLVTQHIRLYVCTWLMDVCMVV